VCGVRLAGAGVRGRWVAAAGVGRTVSDAGGVRHWPSAHEGHIMPRNTVRTLRRPMRTALLRAVCGAAWGGPGRLCGRCRARTGIGSGVTAVTARQRAECRCRMSPRRSGGGRRRAPARGRGRCRYGVRLRVLPAAGWQGTEGAVRIFVAPVDGGSGTGEGFGEMVWVGDRDTGRDTGGGRAGVRRTGAGRGRRAHPAGVRGAGGPAVTPGRGPVWEPGHAPGPEPGPGPGPGRVAGCAGRRERPGARAGVCRAR
jgi:hypothetical protein